jgi:hypothetical protein
LSSLARFAIALAGFVLGMISGPIGAVDRTQLAVIVNTWDPLSEPIGAYYAERRGLLFQNIIRIGFLPTMTR